MSTMLDETSADVPVRDVTVSLSRPAAASQDSSLHHNVRQRQDVSRVSREELEDRYLRLHEENLLLKQHIHEQDDKIRKLGTKLMRLVKDRGRLEQLAVGGAQLGGRLRDVEMEEVMEELQEKVRGLQAENQGLKQRLLVAKQQLINSQSRRPSPYGHVQARVHTRVNTGSKRPRDDPPSPSPSQTRPKSTRSLEGAGRPPTSQLPRYGHSLLEEARAEIRNLENVIESQRSHMEEVEAVSEQLREDLRRKEVEHEEKLLQLRQQHSSKLRSQVNSSVSMVKLQQQLSVRSNAVTELQSRFVQLQQSQVTLKAAHDAAMLKVDELSKQLRDERLKRLELEQQLQTSTISRRKVEQLEEQVKELEQERDLLKENNEKLVNSALDVSQQQRWLIQEQQLRLQVSQLEAALKNDLVDKNQILDKVQAERELSEKLTEENQRLQVQILEQKQQQEELSERLRIYSRNEYDASELTEALLLVKNRRSQRRGELGFLKEEDETTDISIRELRAAHAETIQELEKTRNLLNMETRISRDYKAELDVVTQKMSSDKMELELKLQRQTRLLDAKMAKIHKLEGQLSDVAYGTKTYVFRPDVPGEEEDESEESVDLERGENLVELQIVGATLTPSILETLGDGEPSTFCTYSFYLFELHSTPVVMGANPRYGFTSRYVVNMDDGFLDYVSRSSVTVELHQALGLDWRTLGTGQLRLQQLLEHDGKIHGSVPLVGSVDGLGAVGSVEFWLRLRVPVTESVHLHRERVKAVDYVSSTQTPIGGSWNQLFITVHSCGDLRSRTSQQPSPYVIYKFLDFSDSISAIVYDRCDPVFDDLRSYSVLMDEGLDQYLRSEVLQVYVFDNKEEQVDTYLGKAKVPLLPLIQDQMVTGKFELNDPSGLPAGHVQVTLRWEFPYPPSPEEPAELHEEEEKLKNSDPSSLPPSLPPLSLAQVSEAEVSLSQLRLKSQVKDGAAAKRVTFIDSTGAEEQDARRSADRRETTSPLGGQVQSQVSPGSTPQEEEEEESHVSEGQLVPVSSDDSEVSEDLIPDEASAANQDQSESTHSDSDDCIVQGSAAGRKASERVRVEVVSLNLRAESVVACDVSVVRLFVEYNFLDLPTEETPLSLPKPPPGSTINYNYSKVFPVDAQDNRERRSLLRDILQGRRPHMDRIRFTVVSEPPEEEEQERDCEDVGVAFVSITDIMDTQRDLMETNVPVVGVDNSSEVVGTLTVSVEALEALRSIMQDQDQDQAQDQDQDPERTLVSSLFPSS